MTSARSTIVRAGIAAVGAGLAAGLLTAPPATAATSTGPRLTVPTSTM
ncbi:MAG: hypothetical protein H7290_04035, partial [Flavobacterium sp.]|nr:hypothetical protein [Aeromicrobium sp.]